MSGDCVGTVLVGGMSGDCVELSWWWGDVW